MKTNASFLSPLTRNIRLLLTTALILTGLLLHAENFTKSYKEKYSVQKGAVLALQNKFGDIHCQLWDENAVSINVTITVDASSQERANKVFDKITVQLSGNPSRVTGVTNVGSINNSDFSIDYDIRIPRWMNLDIDNKFGEIFLDEIDGTAKINLEYGAMEVNSLNSNQNTVILKFSDGEAGFIKSGSINIQYGEWETEGSEKLDVYSRFSEITIGKSGSLKVDSQYDEINIGQVGQIISVSRFSDVDAKQITGDFDFDTEYGEVAVDRIAGGFAKGRVRNAFAGVSLGFEPGASFMLNAEMKFGELNYPRGNSSLNHEVVGYTTNIYKGRVGSGSNPSAQLSIDSRNADVTVRFIN
jgi:hypothetical protein